MTDTTRVRFFFVDYDGPTELARAITAALASVTGGAGANGAASSIAAGPASILALPETQTAPKPEVTNKETSNASPAAPPSPTPKKTKTAPIGASPGKRPRMRADDRRTFIATYLRTNGPRSASAIQRDTNTSSSTFDTLMKHPWFERDAQRLWHLTPVGVAGVRGDNDSGDD